MFIAKDIDGNNVTIEEAELFEKENPGVKRKYFCPSCGAELKIDSKESKYKKIHFKHKRGTLCNDDWNYDMSEWHRNWQNCFPKECQEVVMTNKQGEKHRADVCINNFVIEFQHSPISAEEVKSRNVFYTELGYNIVWVFDANNSIRDLDGIEFNEKYPIERLYVGNKIFEWKRKKTTFANFKFSNNMDIFFETQCNNVKTLFLVKPKDEKRFERMLFVQLIKKENFLKQYGAIDSNEIPSIRDIKDYTDNLIKNQFKNRQKGYIYRPPTRRRWHF